jgi:putative ABC transport system permease protein
VAEAHDYMAQFAFWKKADGGNESVIMVGFDIGDPVGGPWNLVEGRIEDLAVEGGIILDLLYREKLGVHAIGDTLEINNRRARVVGFTSGIRTFTQSPYVFTTHANARRYTFVDDDRTTYVLVRLQPGADAEAVRAALQARMPDVRVWTREDFSNTTRLYWMVTTGAGAALCLAAILGLVVGIVIVGQTLYASTVDRLPEYATLRAMGAPNAYLYEVILKQAAISAVLGFAAGFAVTGVMVIISLRGNIAIAMPWWLALVLAALTALMCAAGAIFSIRRVVRIEPSSVFA